jgi:hypothetical protein
MKRSEAIRILTTVLTKYNTGAPWYNETRHAGEVISILEQLNLLKPTHSKTVIRRDLELIPYEDTIIMEGWEDE